MSSNGPLNQVIDDVIFEYKKQLHEIKRNKFGSESSEGLIKEIENYDPGSKGVSQEMQKRGDDHLNLNFSYKLNKERNISQQQIDKSLEKKKLVGKIKHRNESQNILKHHVSDLTETNKYPNNENINNNTIELMNKYTSNSLQSREYSSQVSLNKFADEVEYLKTKLRKKKAKVQAYREKAFLLDQRLHIEEKKNLSFEETNSKLEKICINQKEELEITKENFCKFEKIVDYFVYFLNKIQNLYPSNFKRRDLRTFLNHKESELENFRGRLIELENFIVKGVIQSNKHYPAEGHNEIHIEEKLRILNEKIFDLEDENKALKDEIEQFRQDYRTFPDEKKNEKELNRLKTFENRLLELEKQLNTKVSDVNKNEEAKSFYDLPITNNNIATGSSGEEINILNSRVINTITSQSISKEERKDKEVSKSKSISRSKVSSSKEEKKKPNNLKSVKK